MKVSIGEGVTCDLEALVGSRLLVQANSGGGKSWCIRRLLEQTHGHVQHLVIDPEGEFASLRERYDYVLAAREDGDTAADPRSAKLLAEKLLELKVSAIINIYELKAHERVRFVRLFLEALVDAPKRLWHPALVVVDEAHVYCPQKGDAESAGAIVDLATRGRKRGFCAVLATQRLSKLHKDAAAECNNKLIGRCGLDVDMKRASEELGFAGREEQHQLRLLEPGEFFAFGPALAKTVTAVKVGAVQTTHPEAGAHIGFTAPPPTEKVREMLPKLADLPAEAEGKARTLADLQRDLATTRRELTLAKKKGGPPAEKAIERRVTQAVAVAGRERATALRQAEARATTLERTMKRAGQDIAKVAERLGASVNGQTPVAPPPPQPVRPVSRPEPRREPQAMTPPADVGIGGPLAKAERLILTALAQYPEGRSKVQLALLAGYAVKGGGFKNAIGALRSKGYATGGKDRLEATPEGLEALGSWEPLPTGHALLEHWIAQLGKAERCILEPLADCYPETMTKEELGEVAGYEPTAGGFKNALGRLRTLELIERGVEPRLSAHLIEEG